MRAYIATMKTSAGIEYYTMMENEGREISLWVHKHPFKNRNEYEVAKLNWVITGEGEQPKPWDFPDPEDEG